MDAETFWNNVKLLCKIKRVTQETLASSCGLNYRTLQNWISRKILPDVVSAFKISNFLKTTVEYLVTSSGITNSENTINPAAVELKELKAKLKALLDD